MATLQTSAATIRDLIGVIRDFANARGWSTIYDDIIAAGQLGLSKGNCHIAIGHYRDSGNTADLTVTRTDVYNGGTLDDYFVMASLSTGLDPLNKKYWSHPGSLATSYSDTDAVQMNHMNAPFTNVWLFSDDTGSHIHVVINHDGDTYEHFSFGHLDKKQMTHPDIAYCTGNYTRWWPNQAQLTDTNFLANDVGSSFHDYSIIMGSDDNVNVSIPDGFLDPSYGFTDGAYISKNIARAVQPSNQKSWATTNDWGSMLDFFLAMSNQETTGGTPLFAIPYMYQGGDTGYHLTYAGEMPNARLVNIADLAPAQEISYASEKWMVFPLKRKTSRTHLQGGSDEVGNGGRWATGDWGVAYKVTT